MRLTDLGRPFLVCVLTERTVAGTIATMRRAASDGADAFELNLPLLTMGREEAASLFSATRQPIYTSCRRAAFMRVYGVREGELPEWSDMERMQRQLDVLALGSVGLDMEMDTFDPHPVPPLGTPEAEAFAASEGSPAELTHDEGALARQREVIRAAREAGGEVILSCHTGRHQSASALIAIAERAAALGADLVKIVSPCPTGADLIALLEATERLRGRLAIPYILVGAGKNGLLSRSIGMALGSAWALGQQALRPGGFDEQPLIAHLRQLRDLLPPLAR